MIKRTVVRDILRNFVNEELFQITTTECKYCVLRFIIVVLKKLQVLCCCLPRCEDFLRKKHTASVFFYSMRSWLISYLAVRCAPAVPRVYVVHVRSIENGNRLNQTCSPGGINQSIQYSLA